MTMRNRAAQAEKFAEAVEGGRGDSKDKLVNVYKLVGASFAAGGSPVERILSESSRRALQEKRLDRLVSKRRPWRIVAIAATVVGLTVALMVAAPRKPNSQTIIAKALAALESDDGVLYLKKVQRHGNGGTGTYTDESWLDERHSRYRMRSFYNGALMEDILQIDDVYQQYSPEAKYISISGQVVSGPAWMFREREDLVKALKFLREAGRATISDEVADGQETVRFEYGSQTIGALQGDASEPEEKNVVNVDKETFLPVRIARYERKGDKWELRMEQRYDQSRRIAFSQVPADTFSLKIPGDTKRESSGNFNFAMAKAYKDLKLFYLGRNFGGLPLVQISGPRPIPADMMPDYNPPKAVFISYVKSWDDPAGDSGEMPEIVVGHVAVGSVLAGGLEITPADRQNNRTAEILQVEGRTAKITWGTDADGRRSGGATIVVGNTEVRVGAADGRKGRLAREPKELVIEALKRLKPLN